jgi:hypothetical protein
MLRGIQAGGGDGILREWVATTAHYRVADVTTGQPVTAETDDANALAGSQESMRLTGDGYQPVASLSATLCTIQPGDSCSITVNFTPHGYGLRSATPMLYDDGRGWSQSVALRGTGTAARPLLSSGFLTFGGNRVGNPSAPQSAVLFNGGEGRSLSPASA